MAQSRVAKHQLPTLHGNGEGVVVGVVRQRTAGGISVQLDFTGAPVPERRFSADGAWTSFGSDMVRVLFAQYKAAGPEIEHVVVLRLPFQGVRMFLTSMKGVGQTASHFLASVENASSPVFDKKSIPNHTFTLDANIIIAGFSGREACMDLYYSSPQVKVALNRGGSEFRAEPVARVTLTTRLMMDIHDELASRIDTLPADVQAEVEVENE